MAIEYRTVDTSTIKGLKEAERLQANGWTIGRSGLWLIYFYRKVQKKAKKG